MDELLARRAVVGGFEGKIHEDNFILKQLKPAPKLGKQSVPPSTFAFWQSKTCCARGGEKGARTAKGAADAEL